jgi:hypothetical protein
METNTQGSLSSKPVWIMAATVLIGVLAASTYLIWYFGFRDTWELDNAYHIRTLCLDAEALLDAGHTEEAILKYDELALLVGQRQIADPKLRRTMEHASSTVGLAKQNAIALISAKDNTKNEPANLEKLEALEKQAKDLVQIGDLDAAKDVLQSALVLTDSVATNSPAFAESRKRLAALDKEVLEKVRARAPALARTLERIRQSTSEATRAPINAGFRGRVKGGVWIGSSIGNSRPLRGVQLVVLKRWVPASEAMSLALIQVTLGNFFVDWASQYTWLTSESQRERYVFQRDAARLWYSSLKAAPSGSMVDIHDMFAILDLGRSDESDAWDLVMSRAAIAETSTDIDGKFDVELAVGRYAIFAQVKEGKNVVYWCQPVDVAANTTAKCDLGAANATARLLPQ